MQTLDDPSQPERSLAFKLPATGLGVILRTVWWGIRLPLFALLVLLEPLVRIVLCGLASLGLPTGLFIHLAHQPFWGTLGISIAVFCCWLFITPFFGFWQSS